MYRSKRTLPYTRENTFSRRIFQPATTDPITTNRNMIKRRDKYLPLNDTPITFTDPCVGVCSYGIMAHLVTEFVKLTLAAVETKSSAPSTKSSTVTRAGDISLDFGDASLRPIVAGIMTHKMAMNINELGCIMSNWKVGRAEYLSTIGDAKTYFSEPNFKPYIVGGMMRIATLAELLEIKEGSEYEKELLGSLECFTFPQVSFSTSKSSQLI